MSDIKSLNSTFRSPFSQVLSDKKTKNKEEKQLEQACKDFESIFVGIMFKSMRAAVPNSGLLNNEHEQTFRDMLDDEYSKEIAKTGRMGIAANLYRQLSRDIKSGK